MALVSNERQQTSLVRPALRLLLGNDGDLLRQHLERGLECCRLLLDNEASRIHGIRATVRAASSGSGSSDTRLTAA